MMDKKLIGKWFKNDEGETLNIFDETPLRMKMSFSSSGYYNFEPNCVYEADGFFCYEINDEYHRRVYRVKIEDGCLAGTYTQQGKTVQIKYEKITDEPEDLPQKNLPTEIYVPESEELRIDVLKRYSDFDRSKDENYKCEYTLGGKAPEILEKYGYSEYIKDFKQDNNDLVFSLLDFVCDHFQHNGYGGTGGSGIEEIIKFTENNSGKTNCRGLSIMLAALLRYNNIKARHITCMPYEDPFQDCHVVVDCLLPSGERVMLDPTYRLYLTDKNNKYVSVPRLREMLLNDEPTFENAKASYNGRGFSIADYRQYMTKNTFRFSHSTVMQDGIDHKNAVQLIPKDYPTDKFTNNGYRNTNFVYNDKVFWEM